jgi:transcriptional/translational regulatory protein YebC/TACO1
LTVTGSEPEVRLGIAAEGAQCLLQTADEQPGVRAEGDHPEPLLLALFGILDAGADDVIDAGDVLEIYTDYRQLIAIRNVLLAAGLVITTVEKAMRPKTIVQADAADALRALKLIERMEDLDDVQKVYSNLDITDEVAEQFAGA